MFFDLMMMLLLETLLCGARLIYCQLKLNYSGHQEVPGLFMMLYQLHTYIASNGSKFMMNWKWCHVK